jgi:run domain Beclin-1 interacting cysteine-rich containing protein
MSYEVLSKSEGIHIDYTVHFKEFTHTTLENQKYKCANCDRKIQNSKLRCHYFGKLYCKLCHLNSKYFIPAKIINNLDIKKYPVSENARHLLESVLRKPIFDIIYDNFDLYSKSSLLNECKKLRLELEHIRWYLQTCKNNNAKNIFIMHLWPDDYLYETIHLYSLFDLTNLKDAFNKIKTARDFGLAHILKDCELCIQKGFYCELCKSDKPIYSFQIDTTVQWLVLN